MSYLGIDLSATPNRRSLYALLDEGPNLIGLDSFRTFDELYGFLEIHKPSVIAIDSPLNLPRGLDCLEEDHSCKSSLDQKGRVAELELARMHIGCFFTTKRSIIKPLIYRGMELNQELLKRGYNVIEVYPYATKVILFGDHIPPKNTARGLAFLRERLAEFVRGLEPYTGQFDHDGCDGILAAYTGYLHQSNRSDLLGVPEEGYIVVPNLLTKAIN